MKIIIFALVVMSAFPAAADDICVYTDAECAAISGNGQCTTNQLSQCPIPKVCKNGYYKKRQLIPVSLEADYVAVICDPCPANATCDGENVACNSGYTLTSTKLNGTLDGEKWCVPSAEENDIIDDVKKQEAEATATVNFCPPEMTLSADGCCCLN